MTNRGKKIRIYDNLGYKDRIILACSEFFGTLFFVFLGCMGCAHPIYNSNLHIAFTFGLAIMVPVQIFAHISGGHVNPVVTMAAVLLGRIPLIHVPIYIVPQIIGALVGFGLLLVVMPSDVPNSICSPILGPGITPVQGLIVEIIITCILICAVAAVWDCRNKEYFDSVSLRLGLVVGVLAMAAIPFSGAHMNPARSLAPALLNGDWEDWWVYWLGPILGSLSAVGIYRLFFSKEEESEAED